MTSPDDTPPPENRPRSGRNRERECAEILDEWLPRVLEMLARKALAGDRIAARIIVQAGLWPNTKDTIDDQR